MPPDPASDPLEDASGRADGFRSERAQVWARHATTGRWLYLPPGQADARGPDGRTWKQLARAGALLCPHQGCGAFATARGGAHRRHHFAHPPGTDTHTDAGGPETTWHLEAKATLATWASSHPDLVGWSVHIDDGPVATPAGWRRPDLLLVSPDGKRRIALEVQHSALTGTDWRARHDFYTEQGIVDIWLWAPVGVHGTRPRPGRRTERDLSGGEIVWRRPVQLGPAQQTQLAAGVVPLWLDPTTCTVATATARYHPAARTPLFLFSEPGRWTLPPTADFTACWLGVDPLDACAVDWERRELATPTRDWQHRQQAHYSSYIAAITERHAAARTEQRRTRQQHRPQQPAAPIDPSTAQTARPSMPPTPVAALPLPDGPHPLPPALFKDFAAPARRRSVVDRLLRRG